MSPKRRQKSPAAVRANAASKVSSKSASPALTENEEHGAAVGEISDAQLTRLFSQPRSPRRMLAGLRALGFTADSVKLMTNARSRDVVYSWAAGRARPGLTQAQRLDEVRRILYFICRHRELGAETAWMLFNAKFAGMDEQGPTAMELIAGGDAAVVIGNLELLVDENDGDGGGGGPPDDDPSTEPSPSGSSDMQPVGSGS